MIKVKTSQKTASGDVKAAGGPATLYFITISNNGTAGTAGEIEIRDAVSPAGDTGTLRWSTRFASADEASVHYEFPEGIYMPDGIRFTMDTVTNIIATIGYAG
jgi:hypothetical protein